MNIILSGGTGFIGQALGAELVSRGHSLTVLTRSIEHAKKLRFKHLAVAWDGEKDILPSEVYRNIDAVIHLAGAGIGDQRWTESYKKKLRESRIVSARNLLKYAPKDLKIYIGASAIGIYPETFEHASKESDHLADNFLAELCKDWEKEPSMHLGPSTRQVYMRTGLVFDSHGGALKRLIGPIQTGLAGPLGDGKQVMSWIDLKDLVGLYVWAIEHGDVSGPLNAVAPYPVTNKELTKALGQKLHRPTVLPVPRFALQIVVGEFSRYLLMSQNVSAEKALQMGYSFLSPRIQDFLEHQKF